MEGRMGRKEGMRDGGQEEVTGWKGGGVTSTFLCKFWIQSALRSGYLAIISGTVLSSGSWNQRLIFFLIRREVAVVHGTYQWFKIQILNHCIKVQGKLVPKLTLGPFLTLISNTNWKTGWLGSRPISRVKVDNKNYNQHFNLLTGLKKMFETL